MRKLECIQAKSILKAFLEVVTELENIKENIREAENIGNLWDENILPAFYHVKNCKEPGCRVYWNKLHELAEDLNY